MLDIIGDTSELSIRRQVAHLNSIISAVLPLGYPMMVLNGGHVAINTDTHGDFFLY